ncbi:MAG: M12 family metallo-peptidase [Bergeyella sp.]
MKRTLLFFLVLLLGFSADAQNLKPIAQKIRNYQISGKNFAEYSLFKQEISADKKAKYEQAAKDISVLKLEKDQLRALVSEQPSAIEMEFPFEGKTVTVELVKNNIFAEGFAVNTDKGYAVYNPGVYYQGIVKGDEKSVAAFSFFEDDVIGVASQPGVGNIVLGKATDSEDFVSYLESKLTGKNPFICGFDELEENQKKHISYTPKAGTNKSVTENCVRVYYELSYKAYQGNSSNVTTATNWMTAVHNNIGTLYENDGVKMAVSEIFVWTSTDPYTGSYGENLSIFRNYRTTFNGDLAHLINYPATTSVAYLNSLCGTYNYAYSGVSKSYQTVPTYSWTVGASTHEMGHSLGSPHTHACAWNGDDTPIDGCGAAAGYAECDITGPIPSEGGTIMSYCHLTGVGTNLALGFGQQPGDLIRSTVESKGCLGTDCITSCSVSVTNVTTSNITNNTANITIVDNVSSSWKYRITKYDGTIVQSGITTEKTLTVTGLEAGTYYKILVGTSCSGSQAYQKTVVILTETDWCSGVFTDTGGESGNYTDSQLITKTFYPSQAGAKLKITFTKFALEEGYDYMNVYDGIHTGAPRFSGGSQLSGNTIPGPFTATNAYGAITVRFISDEGVTDEGWSAYFSCETLAVDEGKSIDAITVSPNPTKGEITISSSDKILSYQIFDTSGRIISEDSKLNANKKTVNLSRKAAGTYLVKVTTDKETVTKKVIKN